MANEERSTNSYDEKAAKLKKVKYVIMALLVFILIFFLVGFRGDITLENIRYLLKYVDVSASAIGDDSAETVIFDEDKSATTGVFRSDLVVLTQNELATYDMSNKKEIYNTVSLTNPSLVIGEKYFAVFDMGENYFSIYNSFSKIYEEKTAYPVWDVVFGDDGEFAIITAEKGKSSALVIYDEDFDNSMNFYKSDEYIISADIHSGREDYFVAGSVKNNERGDFLSTITVLKEGSDKTFSQTSFEGELILSAKFYANSNVCVLTDKALRALDLSGKEISKIEFNPDSLRLFESGNKASALILNENSIGTKHRMIILDSTGNTLQDTVVDSDITDLSVNNDEIILLGSQNLIFCDAQSGQITVHESDKSYTSAHALSRQRALLIYENSAYVVSVK